MIHLLIRSLATNKYLGDCFTSLRKQSVDYRGVLILDPPGNGYVHSKHLPPDCDTSKIKVIRNKVRMGLGRNVWLGLQQINYMADDEDIVAVLDGDDYLRYDALSKVQRTYGKYKCLATYGSYIKLSKGRTTKISNPYPEKGKVRKLPWHGSHLKTFKWKVVKHLPREYLQHEGRWAAAASDLALMFSVIELAGLPNCRHVKSTIYYWRDNYKHSTNPSLQMKWERIMREKKPLKRL